VDEIKDDIRTIRSMVDRIAETSWKYGHGGRITQSVANYFFESDGAGSEGIRSVVAWLYFGASRFPAGRQLHHHEGPRPRGGAEFHPGAIPWVRRITSYCRSQTAPRKSVEDLTR
jgi:hypothetical protein